MLRSPFRSSILFVRISLSLAVCCSFGLECPSIHAQTTGATVTGTVSDASGKLLPNAHIAVKNLLQGVERMATSDGQGSYILPNVLPGTYRFTVTADGFRTLVQQPVELTVGARPVINLKLEIGSFAQSVNVDASAASMESASSALASVVSGETARELPLNGRDWTQLATLQPGVATIRSQPDATTVASRGNRGFGQQLTISGGRPQQNSYRLDGININDYANSAPGSTAGLSLGADSIQEFSVISSNYSAAYGLTSGGVINALTRAGGNKVHGSVYEFVRNDAFDAKSYFDQSKLPFRRNQFGATLGGPVVKDKTFLFGNYEGFRQVLTSTAITTTPTSAARAGNLVAGKVMVDPSIAPYLKFWAAPNGAITGDVGTYQFASKEVTPENFFTVRADQTISQKDTLYATYLFDDGNTQQPDALNVLTNASKTRRQVASIAENHIFSGSFYNSVRVGFNRESAGTLITAPGLNPMGTDPAYGAATGLYAPSISVTGLTTFGGGLNGTSLATYGFTTPQFSDDALLAKGRHTLKFGFAYERILLNTTQQSTPDGLFRFTSLANFLTNKPASLQVQITPGTPRNLTQNIYGGYAEDDWRFTPNLTLTTGIRYEASSVPVEKAGKLANLQTLTAAAPVLGSPFFQNPTLKNFEPRIGFSYSPPMSRGQTNLSGGYGIFDVLPLTYQFNLSITQAAPFMVNLSSSALAPGSFAKRAYAFVSNTTAGKQRETYVQDNPPRNYVQQWNLTLQQDMLFHLNLKVGYVGSHGVHQAFRTTDANVPVPTVTSTGALIFPCTTFTLANVNCKTGGPPINPAFGQIDGQNWTVSSVYSGLLLQVKQSIGKTLQWQASFTWQRSEDGASSVIAGGPFQNSVSGQFLFHPLRGVSDFDVPKVFVVNAIWRVPDTARPNSFASYLVDGWQLGGVFQVANGQPFSPVLGGDILGLGNTVPFDVPDRLTSPGCQGNAVNTGTRNSQNYIKLQCFAIPTNTTGISGVRFGNAARNSLFGPGLVDLDASLVRNFALSFLGGDAAHLELRAEAFNVANRPNLAAPYANNKFLITSAGTISTTSTTGQITSVASSPRQLQLGAKLIF